MLPAAGAPMQPPGHQAAARPCFARAAALGVPGRPGARPAATHARRSLSLPAPPRAAL
jgi:hypothetical protein